MFHPFVYGISLRFILVETAASFRLTAQEYCGHSINLMGSVHVVKIKNVRDRNKFIASSYPHMLHCIFWHSLWYTIWKYLQHTFAYFVFLYIHIYFLFIYSFIYLLIYFGPCFEVWHSIWRLFGSGLEHCDLESLQLRSGGGGGGGGKRADWHRI